MNELTLQPTIPLFREITTNPEGFEYITAGNPWLPISSVTRNMEIDWALGDPRIQIRRKVWVPEVGKLIYVRDSDAGEWRVLKFKKISSTGTIICHPSGGFEGVTSWMYAKPIPPDEVSK